MNASRRFWRVLPLLCSAGCTATQVHYQSLDTVPPNTGPLEAVLYLLGDAGEVNAERDAVLAHLQGNIDSIAADGGPPVTVAFLGDNIYDEGLPEVRTVEDVEKLRGQVLAIGSLPNVRGVFVPGNHDWANGASLPDGRAAVLRQEEWVDSISPGRRIRFLPDDGCPGPATADIGESIHLVFIDTEWLLRRPEQRCGTAAAFYARVTADLQENRDRRVVIMSHHPLVSGGPHGGNVAPFERGPLVYYLLAKSGVIRQDLTSRAYTAMRRGLAQAIAASGAPPLVYAAGHDHSLQLIRMAGVGQPRYQLVSGSASKSSSVRRLPGTRYATDGFGYMRLDFGPSDVRLVVFAREVGGGGVRPVYACTLTQAAPVDQCPEPPLRLDVR